MKDDIAHKGRVVSVTADKTVVEIISQSACAACHAKTLCGLSENVTKSVEVRTDPKTACAVGEEVNVVLSRSMGHKAVWISYVIPLVILVVLVLSLSLVLKSELLAGVCAVAGVGLWYLLVWLFRARLSNDFVFTIEKL